ncbi:MAG: hypothetical protein E7022_03835 [Desulfovibrio desulfuricans]|nr:hypothetical protein [Desulfovibrio desulfuricans]
MCTAVVDSLRAMYGEKFVLQNAIIGEPAGHDLSLRASLRHIPPKQRMARLPYLIFKGCHEHIIAKIVEKRAEA